MSLKGKCALITGSVGGLGFTAAQRFAAAGCNIVLSGFAEAEKIAEARAEIEATGVRSVYSSADLRKPGEIEQMFSEAEGAFDEFALVDRDPGLLLLDEPGGPDERWLVK